MSARGNRVKSLLWLSAGLLCACVHRTASPLPDAGAPASTKGKAGDAGVPDAKVRNQNMSSQNGGFPPLPFNPWGDGGGFTPPTAPSSCPLQVGAECDGNEDCSGGRVCCGTFDQTSFSYTRIACETSCNGTDRFRLCHAGESCESGYVCRRSVILPFSFVSVCAPAAQAPSEMTGRDVAHEVQCGAESCQVGRSKCCLTAHFDGSSPYPVAEPAYCAPIGDSCMCRHQSSMRRDEDAGH